MKLRTGDTVMVRSGKDKGKTGPIIKAYPQLNKVVVDGINIVKKHVKPSQKHPRGGIIEEPQPLPASKVGIVHPDDPKKTSRIGYKFKSDGSKVRVYRQANNKEVKT